MNMFDEARALSGMMKMCDATQGEIAKKLGVSQSYVANKLRLLKLSPKMQDMITDGGLTERHARTLLRLGTEEDRLAAVGKIISGRLNVAESEALVDYMKDSEAPLLIKRAEECERINSFQATLEESVRTLRSLGVSAKIEKSYYGKKTYITVCIEETA